MKEWGSELWDRVDNVDQRFQDSIQKNDRLVRFLREKAQIDHDYSKQLKKLASKYEKGTNDSLVHFASPPFTFVYRYIPI